VFKSLTINMSGPICGCTDRDQLTWSPSQEIIKNEVKWTLVLGCSGCGTRLVVSEKNLVASFAFPKTPQPTEAPSSNKKDTTITVKTGTSSVTVEASDNETKKTTAS